MSNFSPISTQSQSLEVGSYRAKVFGWLFFSFVVCALGTSWLGPMVPPSAIMPLGIGLILTMVLAGFVRKLSFLQPVFLVAVPLILGIVMHPVLESYFNAGQGNVVVMAAAGTALVFGLTGIVAWKSKASIDGWMPKLMVILLAVIGVSLLNVFLFKLSFLSLAIAWVTLIVFTLFTFHDIQKIRDAGVHGEPASAVALNIFLDIINIFQALLRIIGGR